MVISRSSAAVLVMLSAALAAGSGNAAEPVDEDYVRSLAAVGKTVLVIEYYDGNGQVTHRKGYASRQGFRPKASTVFTVDDNTSLHLYGLEPCIGGLVNRAEGYSGSCEAYAVEQLSIKLRAAKVILCRAFVTEAEAKVQDVTCFGYYSFPGTLDVVDNIEVQLVSLGSVRLVRNADGTPLRGDLLSAEKIAQQGFGMWGDPRIVEQFR